LLATRLNNWEIYTPLNSSVTSLGAAITMHSAWNIERSLKEILLFRKWEPMLGIKLTDYSLFE
jgi:hypothetical protein